MMNMKFNLSVAAIAIATLMPCYIHADNSVGNGVKSVVGGVGQGVGDLGTGVGNAVTDVGNGVGNAINGDNRNNNRDADITSRVQDRIQNLANNNRITAGYSLQTQTNNGAVNITGTVMNNTDIGTIKDVISRIRGVQSVNMNVQVQNQ